MIGAVLALALFSGCGGGAGPTATPATGGPTATPATGGPTATPAVQAVACNATGAGTPVAIAGNAFGPASVTVAVGGLVTWTNSDSISHTVTFDSGPNCGTLGGGATQTVQFTVAGTYPYHCQIHPSMKGTVVVQ
jgi:plastocyanin